MTTKEKKSHSKNNPIKEKAVKALAEKIKNSKTLMIVSIKGLPSKQFQDIKKSIREHAQVQVAKKNIMMRSIKAFGKESILGLEPYVQENSAFVLSDMDGYELAGILSEKKNPINAKAGQIAPEDIEIKAGPTELVPGPAISELGAVGLQVSVENGKISIRAPKVIVNKGQVINEATASILQKLNVQPFSVGLEPIAIFDIKAEKIYANIHIDSKEAAVQLSSAAGKALGFAQKIVYCCKETIGYLLAKANVQAMSISKIQNKSMEVKF
ncbi:MAG: 50S ribosomal protein L10 [Candidatus Pacearchaeota archaeon]|jgi:large subunit ribosomal protein L10